MLIRKPMQFFDEGDGGAGTGKPTEKPEDKPFVGTQRDVNNIIARETKTLKERLDAIEAEKNTNDAELEKLLKEKKEREQAELTEVEKLKKQAEDYEKEKANLIKERDTFKTYKEQNEARLIAEIDKELEGASEEDIALVKKLPLEDQKPFIARLKGSKPSGENWGKGPGPDRLTEEEKYRKELREAKTPQEREAIVRKYTKQ